MRGKLLETIALIGATCFLCMGLWLLPSAGASYAVAKVQERPDSQSTFVAADRSYEIFALTAMVSGQSFDALALAGLEQMARRQSLTPPSADSTPELAMDPISALATQLSGQGDGHLQRLENGEIRIRVMLGESAAHHAGFRHMRVFRLIPELAGDTLGVVFAEHQGKFEISFDPGSRTAAIRVDGAIWFRFTVEKYVEGENIFVDQDGVQVVSNGVQISAENYFLPRSKRQDIAGDDSFFTDSTCTNCQAGGSGAGSCSIGGCTGNPTTCSVLCNGNRFACCKCLSNPEGASCVCCTP